MDIKYESGVHCFWFCCELNSVKFRHSFDSTKRIMKVFENKWLTLTSSPALLLEKRRRVPTCNALRIFSLSGIAPLSSFSRRGDKGVRFNKKRCRKYTDFKTP